MLARVAQTTTAPQHMSRPHAYENTIRLSRGKQNVTKQWLRLFLDFGLSNVTGRLQSTVHS